MVKTAFYATTIFYLLLFLNIRLRNARAASAEKHHNSRNSTAPPKNKQNPHEATEALLQNEEGIARDTEIDPGIVGREVAELKIQLNDVCDVNQTNALLFRDLRARLVIHHIYSDFPRYCLRTFMRWNYGMSTHLSTLLSRKLLLPCRLRWDRTQRLRCQSLYSCTSKASKLSAI